MMIVPVSDILNKVLVGKANEEIIRITIPSINVLKKPVKKSLVLLPIPFK